jgi:hypothetical protein
MGVLDDAIRDHLALKRRHGASEQEVERQLDEALGRRGAAPAYEPSAERQSEPLSDLAEPSALADEELSAPERQSALADERRASAAEEPDVVGADEPPRATEPERASPVDELEPDEVLPEEALDDARAREWPNGTRPAVREDEEQLEDASDFQEESTDPDRLWFEQQPPKDFDFDD